MLNKDECRDSLEKMWGGYHSAISWMWEAMSHLHHTLGHSRSSSSKFIGFSFYETERYFSHKHQRITSVWKGKFKAQIFQIFVVTPEEIASNVKVLLHPHFQILDRVSKAGTNFKSCIVFLTCTCMCLRFYQIFFWITVVPPIHGFTIQDFSYP